jgi:hypothetical protein
MVGIYALEVVPFLKMHCSVECVLTGNMRSAFFRDTAPRHCVVGTNHTVARRCVPEERRNGQQRCRRLKIKKLQAACRLIPEF